MTGFNSQSQITVNWQNNGFAKVLSEIKQIEEAAKRLNISGATKKGADGMLRNVKSIKSEQQKLAELELARIKNENQKIKNESEKRRENNKRRRREYEDNQKKIKEKELSDIKKLEDEKTKILNDAQTKQAFLRKQRATNERKERLVRDLKAIQEDRILTKHQRNIEIAERKKAFAEEERLISSKRFDASKRMEKGYINKYGVNSIEAVNAANRRVEAENALLNKNSLLAKAGGNLSKARIASDEFNKKETERAQRLKDSEINKNLKETERAQRNYKKSEDLLNKSKDDMELSRAESGIRKKRMSEYDKDIQISKLERERHIKDLRESKKQISDQKKLLQKTNETDKDYIKIKTELNNLEANKARIASRFHDSNSNVSDAKERKRVHQINRDAQFYTRANVAFTAPAMIGAYKTLSDYKDAESVRIMLTAMYGKEKSGAEYDRLLERQLGSSLSLQKLASVSMAALTHKRNEADQGRVVDEKKLESALEKVITIGTINTVDEGRALKQILDIASKGEALPSKDIIPFLNAALGIDFQATYKEMYGKAFKMTTMSSDIFFKVLIKATESKKFNEAWDTFIKSFKQASERLNESTTNLSAAFGGLLDETLNLKGKMDGASTAFEKIRNWANKRDEKGNPLTSQKVLIGAAVAVAGTLLMGLFNSHKRKAMEFFFKGDVGKFGDFKKSFSDSKGVGRGFVGSSKDAFVKSGFGGSSLVSSIRTMAGLGIVSSGIDDVVRSKNLMEFTDGLAKATLGLTLAFGTRGLLAGLVVSFGIAVAKATRSIMESIEEDNDNIINKITTAIAKYQYSLGLDGKTGRVVLDKNGNYVEEETSQGKTNFISTAFKPKEESDPVVLQEQRELNEKKGRGYKTDIEVWKDDNMRIASELKRRAIEEARRNSSAAQNVNPKKDIELNKQERPVVYVNNNIKTYATGGATIKSEIEALQTGGNPYPSL